MNIALLEGKYFIDKDKPCEVHGVIVGSLTSQTEEFVLTKSVPGGKVQWLIKLTDLLNCVLYTDIDVYQKALIPTLTEIKR